MTLSSAPRALDGRIIDWLSQLQSTTAGHEPEVSSRDALESSDVPPFSTSRPQKRRASSSPILEDPVSPPLTASDARDSETHDGKKMQRTPSPKKRRIDVGGTDPDMTPRACESTSSSQPAVVFLASASSREESISGASSQRSGTGTSSPRKRMAALAVDPDGMVRKVLRREAEGMPKELADLYEALNDCNMGVGVVTRLYEDAITTEARRNPTLRPLPPFVFADPAQREAVGVTPTIEAVLDVLSWANHSEEVRAQEAAWNGDVHSMLLKLAVHGGYRRQAQLVDVANCTTAGIIKEYLVPSLLPKKVDFCIVLDPRSSPDEKDKAMADRIDQRRRTCPLTSINHTDLDSLISRPIVVSIETKRDGGSLEQAQPQAGTWQSAHWNVLARLVAGDGPDGTRELSSGSDGPDPLDALPFLPAIIIQGHEWSLAATTRVGTKKVLWYDCPFGHTRDVLGIYKIVYGVQKLVTYSKDVFWPWYKDAILKSAAGEDG
ncbi:hypothetical protein DL546_007918 [Coniochaeta pulveracea]|uniref:PD-(D/E)XK nuclease-like domain-containing protein n=1 Tax=Coniochaeta pulveracea TaxID=177199 RepID=A0A420YC32_9PEZI|nr:hypothetical protein DL546_007918 [Coniochaeta pulveracea]